MKKALIVIASLVALVLLAAVLIPVIFKDDIRAALDRELANNLNAKVYYNPDAFSLSLFRSFPNLSVTIGELGVAGVDVFENDTLADIRSFNLTLDLMSVIRGDQIRIVNVALDQPTINVRVLEDGTANYDIVKASAETEEAEEVSDGALSIQIKKWEVINGRVRYDDRSIPIVVQLTDLNHTGSGDFASDVFDMITTTRIEGFSLGYDGVEYISGKTLTADVTMAMDLASMKFTFKENRVALNDFGFGFDGFLSMPAEEIEMDITFAGKEIGLTSVLSLIPGVYQEYLAGVDASGQVSFEGFVRGVYSEASMPALAASFGIADGQVRYAEFPQPLKDIQVGAAFDYPSADLKETSFEMDKFYMTLDGEEVTAYLLFRDLEDYYWDFRLNGDLDLEKLTKVVPIADTELKGKIAAALETKGRMSDLEAGRYASLPTSGSLSVSDFYYASPDLPQGFGVASSRLSLNPQEITLTSFSGNAGKTDLNLSGRITNYLQYALAEDASLYGSLDFSSALVDVNEWMTAGSDPEEADTTTLEVIRIPENIDFVMTSKVDLIKYDNLDLRDFNGRLIIREGALRMEKTSFNLLDGYFEMDGAYESTLALEQPVYDFDFSIKDLSIPQAFRTFNTVQKLVPVAEKMNGKFSTNFKVGGTIGEGMMPVYEDMQGAGLIEIAQASLRDVKVLSAISAVSKLDNSSGEVTLQDVVITAEIKNGRLYADPFDMTLAGRKATVAGSTGIDGTMDYTMSMLVPSGQVGQALNSAISSFAGIDNAIGKDINLNLGITGTYDDPTVKLLAAKPAGSGGDTGVKAAVRQKASEELNKKKEEVAREITAKKDSAVSEAKKKAEEQKEEVKEKVEETKEELKDKATDAVKDIFGKKRKGGG